MRLNHTPLRPIILLIAVVVTTSCREHGHENSANAEGPRIASLSPAISITLIELGLKDRIVGRHAWDRAVDESMFVIGDQTGIDYESLARVRPTHVLLQQTADETPKLLLDLAEERDWEILTLPLLALSDIPASVQTLAAEFGDIGEVAANAARLQAQMDRAWSAQPEAAARAGRTLCVYWTSPIGVAGPGSFHHDLLERMGFDALPNHGAPYVNFDLEDLKRLDPDSIIFLSTEITEANLSEALATWRPLELRAVASGRIAAFSDPRYLTPSVAMIDLAEAIIDAASSWPAPQGISSD